MRDTTTLPLEGQAATGYACCIICGRTNTLRPVFASGRGWVCAGCGEDEEE